MYQKKNCIKILFGLLKKAALIFFITILMSSSVYADSGVLNEAKQLVKNYYVNDVPETAINSAATMDELVKALSDPHSKYFTGEEYEQFISSINNDFSGIGVHIDMVTEGVRVISVIDNTPALKAGIKEGDIITEADGHSLAGVSSEEAVSYITGESGTTVHLKVKRDNTVLSFDIVREKITDTTVKGLNLKSGAAYINVSSFGEKTSKEFGAEVLKLEKQYVSGYIIDLRNNGGGFLKTATDMAGYFLSGKPALLTKDKQGNENTYFASTSTAKIDKPVVFLINGYSASASEILSAAVKDHKKAFIVGTKSYGKGTVQSMFPLSDGGVLKLTVQKFFSPFGNVIDKAGVLPDLEAEDADPLLIGELLLSSSNGRADKKGFVKLSLSGREFEIDLSLARQPGYLKAYNKIIDSALLSGTVSIGEQGGFTLLSGNTPDEKLTAIYPRFVRLPDLDSVPVDKKFTIKFSSAVDALSIKNGDIELVDAASGERIPLSFENIDDLSIKAVPGTNLVPGQAYYFLVNDLVKSKDSQTLSKGVITKVSVEQ